MNNFRWIGFIAALVLAAGIGVMAYNAGVAHGIVQSGKIAAAPAPPAYPYYGWHPWGPGFFIAPFFAILFFFFFLSIVARVIFGGRWHRAGCGGHAYLDEWHRAAHERFHEQHGGTPQS